MLDDVGPWPIIFIGFVALIIMLIEFGVSVFIVFILNRIVKNHSGRDINIVLRLMMIVPTFFLIGQVLRIPSMIEEYQKNSYVVRTYDENYKINDFYTSLDGNVFTVSFELTVPKSAVYLMDPVLYGHYRLKSVNGEEYFSRSMPKVYLEAGTPKLITFLFSSVSDQPDPPKSFSLNLIAHDPEFDINGYRSILFTGRYDKDSAWYGEQNKTTKEIYIKEFDFSSAVE